MPQIGVNAQTTFSQIHNQLAPSGGGGDQKHIRFSAAKGLYTSQKASLAKLEDGIKGLLGVASNRLADRAQKQGDSVPQIKAAIDREYGPGHADVIFGHILGQSGQNLNQGIRRADLEKIYNAINYHEQLIAKMPTGLTIDQNGQLGGQSQFTSHLTGDSVSLAVQKSGVKWTAETDQVNGHAFSRSGARDIHRMNINWAGVNGVPFCSQDTDVDTVQQHLTALTGGDHTKALVLSAALNQDTLNVLLNCFSRPDGDGLRLRMPPSDGTTMRDNNGNIGPVNGRQYAGAHINVVQVGNDYRVDLTWPLHFKGASNPLGQQPEDTYLPLHDSTKGAVRANITTSFTIDGQQAGAGNFVLTGPPMTLNVGYEGRLY